MCARNLYLLVIYLSKNPICYHSDNPLSKVTKEFKKKRKKKEEKKEDKKAQYFLLI